MNDEALLDATRIKMSSSIPQQNTGKKKKRRKTNALNVMKRCLMEQSLE
jgi:hypothetical protein